MRKNRLASPRLASPRLASPHLAAIALASTVFVGSFGCKMPNPAFDGAETGESDTGIGVVDPDPGVWWCAHFPQPPGALAEYEEEDPPDNFQDIKTATGAQPSACRCAHPALDAFLENELEAGYLYIDTDVMNAWDLTGNPGERPWTFREALFAEVSVECEYLADAYHPNREGANAGDNCQSAFDTDHAQIPIVRDGGACYAWVTYGDEEGMVPLPSDSWSDYFTLTSVITYNSGLNLYTINGGFFNAMLQTPAWLIEDGAYVDFNGSAYQLYNVTSGTIAHALGLQSGDIPQTLNNIDISTMDGVMQAWTTLQQETEFELVVLRGTNMVTLDYFVAYVL